MGTVNSCAVTLTKKCPSVWYVMFICGLLSLLGTTTQTFAGQGQQQTSQQGDVFEMSIEQLLDLDISVASKKSESLTEAPGVVAVVPRDEIKLYGDRDLQQLLQRQPSVYTRSGYLYPHNIASFRGNMPTHLDLHTLLLINGRPVRDSAYGGYNLSLYESYPLESLGSVEMVRGPGSVLYGTNAFTGIVNLKSRTVPEQTAYSLSGRAGSEGYYHTNLSGGGRIGGFGYVTDVQFTGQQGFNYAMYDGRGVYGSMHDRNKSISTMTHIERGGLTFDVFASNLELAYVGTLPFWNASNHDLRVNRLFGNAGYRLPLHERVSLEFNLTYNLLMTDFARFGYGDVDLGSNDWLGEVTLFANPLDKLNVVLGFLQEEQRKMSSANSNPVVDPPYNLEPMSAYAQADYKIAEFLKLIAGSQWNKAAYGATDLLSRFGVILTPSTKWGVKLLRGEAFRAPFALETGLNDQAVLVGNKALKPEEIVTYDAQLFYQDEKTYAAVTYYNSQISDLIIRGPNPTPPPSLTFKNGGEKDIGGIELELKRFLTPQWHIIGSCLYQQTDQTSDINPTVVPGQMFKFGTAYTWDWGSAAIFYSFFSKPPRLATEIVRNPEPDAMNLLSFNVRLDMARWMDTPKGKAMLTLRGENLLDKDIYVPEFMRGGNPNSLPEAGGATFYAGFEMKF